MATQILIKPSKEVQKAWDKKREFDKESMPQVVKLWQEVNTLKNKLALTYEDMPMSMSLQEFNRKHNEWQFYHDDKIALIDYLEHITDVQGIKYKPEL